MKGFSDRKFSWKNFFAIPTFKEEISARKICVYSEGFLREKFLAENFFFNSYFLRGLVFKSKILGKKFASNCSAHIAKNPRGHWGRGFRGPGSGGYMGSMPGLKKEKPGGVMGLTRPGTSKALHPMAPASPIPLYHFHLLHCFGYISSWQGGFAPPSFSYESALTHYATASYISKKGPVISPTSASHVIAHKRESCGPLYLLYCNYCAKVKKGDGVWILSLPFASSHCRLSLVLGVHCSTNISLLVFWDQYYPYPSFAQLWGFPLLSTFPHFQNGHLLSGISYPSCTQISSTWWRSSMGTNLPSRTHLP